jgi:hypothetical protein
MDPNPINHADADAYNDLDFEEGDPPLEHRPSSPTLRQRGRNKRGTLSLSWADAELLETEAKTLSTAWHRVTYMNRVQEIVAAYCRKQREDAASKKAAKTRASKPTKKPAAKKAAKAKKGARSR